MTPEQIYTFAATIRLEERNRIIALLEALLKRTKMRGEYDDNNIGECVGIESAVALIRGEN
jgi:hypothetical protein